VAQLCRRVKTDLGADLNAGWVCVIKERKSGNTTAGLYKLNPVYP
jgi:hypothetical protein